MGFHELQRLLPERQSQVQLPGNPIRSGEIAHADERLRMAGAELRFLELQLLFAEPQGQVELPGRVVGHGEAVHGFQRVGMISAEQITAESHGPLQEPDRLLRLPRAAVVHADDPAQLGFGPRVQVFARPEFRRRPVQQFPQGGVLAQRLLARAAETVLTFDAGESQEVVPHEPADRLGEFPLALLLQSGRPLLVGGCDGKFFLLLGVELGESLALGPLRFSILRVALFVCCRNGEPFLLLRLDQPQRRAGDARQQGAQQQTRGDHLSTVPLHELLQPVAGTRWAGLDDLVGQVPLDVAGQPVGRVVPAGAVLLQRLQHHPIEFALHELRELRRLGAAIRGDARQGVDGGQLRTRPWGLDFADDPQDL